MWKLWRWAVKWALAMETWKQEQVGALQPHAFVSFGSEGAESVRNHIATAGDGEGIRSIS